MLGLDLDANRRPVEGQALVITHEPHVGPIARAIIDANRFMTLGTADRHGLGWVSPLWYASLDYREFLWVASVEASHSCNLAACPQVSIVIFDSQGPVDSGRRLNVSAVAEELTGTELERGIELFSRASEDQGARAWTPADVLPPAADRLYRATASELSVLGSSEGDNGVAVYTHPTTRS
jgi:pyridoxamine 5'-phosphate oxidase-like protein